MKTLQENLFCDLLKAYQQCRISKPFSKQQTYFEMRLSENLAKLTKDLYNQTYKLNPHHYFILTHPKPREIFSAHFKDRVIHHYLVSKLTPKWGKKLSANSFACQIGKGTLAAVKYFQKKYIQLAKEILNPFMYYKWIFGHFFHLYTEAH